MRASNRQARPEANPETRAALREGAREHAQYQQALPPQPTAPTWQEAHRPTLEELEAVCGGQEPRRYPQAYGSREQEHAARIEALERRVVALERKSREIGPHTPIGPGLAPKPAPPPITEHLQRLVTAAKQAQES